VLALLPCIKTWSIVRFRRDLTRAPPYRAAFVRAGVAGPLVGLLNQNEKPAARCAALALSNICEATEGSELYRDVVR
jgi:hypothetical protein